MTDRERFIEAIKRLIAKYKSKEDKDKKDMSEANVRKNFIDELFDKEILGWSVREDEYDAESYVRGVGFADVAIKVNDQPKMFIEAKKFGGVPSRLDRCVQITLKGHKVYADWTEEERQVLNYAGATVGVKWAILTNFEKFRLFNAKTGETVLNIENPDEYLEKIDDILLLTKENVINGNIDKLEDRVERPDVDIHFLNLIKKWQLIIATEIYNNNSALNLEEINLYVQRILDRLVIVRYAEDNWVLDNPDQLKTIRESANKSDYVSLTDILINFFNGFDNEHNSKIFEKNEKINEIIRNIDDSIFNDLIRELYNQSFRKFTSDILGNTYESYLSSKLCLKDGKLHLQFKDEARKDGIVYTPPYVVDYIVENTLGKRLEILWNEVIELFKSQEYETAVLKFKEIYDLKVLDPACGSGSFLIKAHDKFLKYYNKYEIEVKKANKVLKDKVALKEISEWDFTNLTEIMKVPLRKFEKRILKKNIYGVDLDENAAEIASVNLMLRALKPHEKLPLILYENIKVGNSLVTGVDDLDELMEHSDSIKELIKLREGIKSTQDLKKKSELENEHNELKKAITKKLNDNLFDHFEDLDVIKPFNWEVEFPEVFYNDNGDLKDNYGFDIIIGNPPYVQMQKMPIAFRNYCEFGFPETYASQNDLWYYFSIKGSLLLKNYGLLGYITSRYFLEATHAKKTRKFLIENNRFLNLIDFGGIQIFEGIGTHASVFLLEKADSIDPNNLIKIVKVKKWNLDNDLLLKHIITHLDEEEYEDNFVEIFFKNQSDLDENIWSLSNKTSEELIKKIKNHSKLIDLCDIGTGIKSGYDPAFVVTEREINDYQLERAILKKWIKNSDIRKYSIRNSPFYVIYTISDININDYPNIKKYLSEFKDILKEKQQSRGENRPWFELYRPREYLFVEPSEKILCPYKAPENRFAYDNKGICGSGDIYGLISKEDKPNISLKYILAILNSKLINYYYTIEGKKKGSVFEYYTEPLSKIPIPEISADQQTPIIEIVNRVLILIEQKNDLISSFFNLIRISKQNTFFTPLNFYLKIKNAPDYKINLLKTEILIDENKEGKPRSYKVYEMSDCLFINVTYADNSNEDILKIHFDDPVLKEFFHLAIYLITDGVTKAYRTNKNILNTILTDIGIPRYKKLIEKDIQNIELLMENLEKGFKNRVKDKYIDSPAQELSLALINNQIDKNFEKIDEKIYKLYGLSEEEIKLL